MLHVHVLLAGARLLVELTLVAVVLAVAAAHLLLGLAIAAQRAHAFGRQAVRGLDAGAAVAARHLAARVLQSCREQREGAGKVRLGVQGVITDDGAQGGRYR